MVPCTERNEIAVALVSLGVPYNTWSFCSASTVACRLSNRVAVRVVPSLSAASSIQKYWNFLFDFFSRRKKRRSKRKKTFCWVQLGVSLFAYYVEWRNGVKGHRVWDVSAEIPAGFLCQRAYNVNWKRRVGFHVTHRVIPSVVYTLTLLLLLYKMLLLQGTATTESGGNSKPKKAQTDIKLQGIRRRRQ